MIQRVSQHVIEGSLELVEDVGAAKQGHAAAGEDALVDGRAGRVERVLDARLLLVARGRTSLNTPEVISRRLGIEL